MTLTRFLLITLALVGSVVAFLTFAPPQTGKWMYMWQAHVWPADPARCAEYQAITPPDGYVGIWSDWGGWLDDEPYLQQLHKIDGTIVSVYDPVTSTDRRTEFGIEVK